MSYKTTKDMLESFKWFAGNFNEKKGSFPVHSDYLIDNMTESEFNSAYDEYRKVMLDLQNDMCDKPDEYGLFTYDKNNNAKPAYQNNYPYLWLFLALSLSGEIKTMFYMLILINLTNLQMEKPSVRIRVLPRTLIN